MVTGFVRSLRDGTETVFSIDVTLSEGHSSEAEITQHPVEDGTTIADHIILKNKTVEISGFIGEQPNCNAAVDLYQSSAASRMSAAYQRLEEVQASGKLLSLVTGLKAYNDLLITSVSSTQDRDTGQLLWFNFSAEQVRVVGLETVRFDTVHRGDVSTKDAKVEDLIASGRCSQYPKVTQDYINCMDASSQG